MIPGVKKRVFTFHDVMMYVAIARNHVRLMLLTLSLCLLGGLTYYVWARPVFYSRALVRADVLVLPVDNQKLFKDGAMYQVLQQLQSPHIMERTARRLGVKASQREIYHSYIKKIGIRTNSERDLEIEMYPYKVAWAYNYPKFLIEEFLKDREEKRLEYQEQTVKAFTREMEQVGEKLDEKLGAKFDFSSERQMTETLINLNRMRTVPSEIVTIKKRLSDMETVAKNLESGDLDTVAKLSLIDSLEKSDNSLSVGQMVGDDSAAQASFNVSGTDQPGQAANPAPNSPGVVVVPSLVPSEKNWQQLDHERTRIQNEVREALVRYQPGSYKMRPLTDELEKVNRRLDVEYEVAKQHFDLDYKNTRLKLADLERQLPEYTEAQKAYEKVKQEYALHDAGQLAWGRMYSDMAKRLTTLDFAQDKERVNLQYVGLLDVRNTPVSPARGKLMAMGLLIGMVLAVGIPFLIEYLDHTVSNIEEVEANFKIRGLGIVPQLDESEMDPQTVMDSQVKHDNNMLENFRVIRTNLISMGMLTKAPHVIMTTSAMPKEGKTVVSSNLAYSFAQMGARTLLVDTDLRRGRMHRLFGHRKSPGLSEVLTGEVTLEEALRPSGKDNLTILSAGKHLESGTELLGSARFAGIMDDLRSRYDRIILDTPPVLGLSETSVMQGLVDGVLFVIWSGRTPARSVKTAVEILQSNGANFYGFILNRLDLSATTNYYQYYYYSNDYYYNYHAIENA